MDLISAHEKHIPLRVPGEVLVFCDAGQWPSVISSFTLSGNRRRYRDIARACPHYSVKNSP